MTWLNSNPSKASVLMSTSRGTLPMSVAAWPPITSQYILMMGSACSMICTLSISTCRPELSSGRACINTCRSRMSFPCLSHELRTIKLRIQPQGRRAPSKNQGNQIWGFNTKWTPRALAHHQVRGQGIWLHSIQWGNSRSKPELISLKWRLYTSIQNRRDRKCKNHWIKHHVIRGKSL